MWGSVYVLPCAMGLWSGFFSCLIWFLLVYVCILALSCGVGCILLGHGAFWLSCLFLVVPPWVPKLVVV